MDHDSREASRAPASLPRAVRRAAAAFACLAALIGCAGSAGAAPNLAGNPSFETGTTGWKVYNGSSIACVSGGADGAWALEVRGASDLTTFGINDSPNWVTPVAGVGVRYRFSAKVRSSASRGSARLQIREYEDGVQRGTSVKTTPVPLATTWTRISGEYVVTTPNSTLDFQILDIPVAPNETFLIDDVSIIVVLPDQPPVVRADSSAVVNEEETLGLSVTAADPDGDPITSLVADLSGLPAGAGAAFTVDPGNASGLLTWTPGFDDAGGPYVVRFYAGNALAGVAATEITVNDVDRPPVIDAPPLVAARDSGAIVVEVAVFDPDGEPIDQLAADLSALPPGSGAVFTTNPDRTEGALAWTPALGASAEFTVRFFATNRGADTVATRITIARIEHPPVILAPAEVATSENEAVEIEVRAFDPDGEPFVALAADLGALPAGAVFTAGPDHASGVLAWRPGFGDAGVYEVVFTADNGEIASAAVVIEVRNVDRPPLVVAPALVTAFVGERASFAITAADPDGEPIDLLSADLAGLPSGHGAGFTAGPEPATAAFEWTPVMAELGSYTVPFRAANALVGSASVTIVVRPPNRAPVAALAVSPEVTSTPMLVTASAIGSSDPEGDSLTYRFDFGDGIVVGPQASPVASATLAASGIHEVAVIVTDAFGACDTATFTVRAHLGNLVQNTSMENTSVGWGAYGGSVIARVAGVGRSGSWAFEARGSGSLWGFNDVPDWVLLSAGPGRTYRYLAWVRSPTSRGQVFLRVQEFFGTAQRGVTRLSPAVTLSDEWQLVSVDYVVTSPGTRLDMKVLYQGSEPGARFLIDDVQILLLPAGDQPPVIQAPAAVTAIAGQPLEIEVRAADPDGQSIEALAANLLALPSENDATFVPAADRRSGTLRWTPRAADVGPVPYVVEITAANALPAMAPIEVVVASAPLPNLCRNPSFEINASGWSPYVYGTTIERINSSRTGSYCVRLTHATESGWGLNDELDIVSTAAAPGRTYRYSAWVRSANSGGRVRMRVQEFLGTLQKGVTVESPEIPLTPEWRRLAVSYTVTTPGTRLDMKIVNAPVALGESFLVDDVEVLLLPAGDRPPVMSAPEVVRVTREQPMTVSVAVADPDGDPIHTLTADLSGLPPGNDAVFTPGPGNGTGILSWTPGAADARATPYRVTFLAANARRAVATTAIEVGGTAYPNLCANPGFESNLSGWGTWGAVRLARVAGGRSGGYALRLAAFGASGFGADDSPNVVASVVSAGDRYRFSAWVRSDSSTSPVRLRVYEFLGGVQLGPVTYSFEMPVSSTWQLLTVEHVAIATGSTLSLRIAMMPTAADQKFLVDDVVVQRIPAGTALVAGALEGGAPALPGPVRGPRAIADDPRVGAGREDLLVRIEGAGALLEGGPPEVTMKRGARELAVATAAFGEDSDADGIVELAARFAMSELRASLAASPSGTVMVVVSLRGRDGETLEVPLALEWSGEELAFAASFAPIPMRGEGTLAFTLPRSGPVRVDLFDPAGRRVRTLVNEPQARAGRHAVSLRSRDVKLAAGVYFYRVDAAEAGTRSGRIVVLE